MKTTFEFNYIRCIVVYDSYMDYHSNMPSRQRNDLYPLVDDNDRGYNKTNIISKDYKINHHHDKEPPKLKYNRSFGGFEHMYDPVPNLNRKRSGASLNSRQINRGESLTYQFSQQYGCESISRVESKKMVDESKMQRHKSENRHRKHTMDFRIEPINEKGITIFLPENSPSDTDQGKHMDFCSELNSPIGGRNYRNIERRLSYTGYSDPGMDIILDVDSPVSGRNNKKYERKISNGGFSDPGTLSPTHITTLERNYPLHNVPNKSKSPLLEKKRNDALQLKESHTVDKKQDKKDLCGKNLLSGRSLDSHELTSKPILQGKHNEQSQSLDYNSRRSRTLTRQKTFRMDSVEMIEALLGATTFRNNNNVTFPSNISTKEKKASLKRNSAPDNVRPTISRQKRNSQPTTTTNKLQDYRLVVLGSGAVGKSSLVTQFLNGFFPCQYKPTVEDSYRHLVQLPDGVFHTIEILDTAGLHQFPAMRRLSILSGDAFIVVFSLESKESFKEALELIQLIFDTKGINPSKERVPIILVGNKSDLQETREVTHEEAVASALQKNLCAYLQTSAKHNENVQQLFSELLIQTFGVQEKLEEKHAKKPASFRGIKKQLSDKVLSIGKRHHSDSDAPVCTHSQTVAEQRSSFNPGCSLSEPTCCIL